MKKKTLTFREFLNDEMRIRHMGVNEFADFVGVGHSLISNHTNENPKKKVPTPSVKFLRQLAKATGTSLIDLFAIVFPEVREEAEIDPEANIFARRIMKFQEKTGNALIGIIESFEKSSDKD